MQQPLVSPKVELASIWLIRVGVETCMAQRSARTRTIQVDQPDNRENVESSLGCGCARGGTRTRRDGGYHKYNWRNVSIKCHQFHSAAILIRRIRSHGWYLRTRMYRTPPCQVRKKTNLTYFQRGNPTNYPLSNVKRSIIIMHCANFKAVMLQVP